MLRSASFTKLYKDRNAYMGIKININVFDVYFLFFWLDMIVCLCYYLSSNYTNYQEYQCHYCVIGVYKFPIRFQWKSSIRHFIVLYYTITYFWWIIHLFLTNLAIYFRSVCWHHLAHPQLPLWCFLALPGLLVHHSYHFPIALTLLPIHPQSHSNVSTKQIQMLIANNKPFNAIWYTTNFSWNDMMLPWPRSHGS